MKWLSFFILLIFIASCKDGEKKKQAVIPEEAPANEQPVSYNDTVKMPYKTDYDSGYFKGYIPEKIDELEINDSSHLSLFLSRIISKKDIVLLSDETLSHSVMIDHKTNTRYDTLKNKQCTIVSIYKFGDSVSQRITINGVLLKTNVSKENSIINDDQIDFNGHSFRYFSFKGTVFYYIQAGSFDSFGTSMGNVIYHLIYSIKDNQLNCYETCRMAPMLFGDVNGDDHLDYLDFDNSDFCTTIPYSQNVTIQLYSCDKKGKFVLQKDAAYKPYFIDGNTGHGFEQDSFNVKKYKWPKPL
jgi:hypothetical protein